MKLQNILFLDMETAGPGADNFSGPKSYIQIEVKRIRARVLANKILHFVPLADNCIMLDAKLLKLLSCMQTTTALRDR